MVPQESSADLSAELVLVFIQNILWDVGMPQYQKLLGLIAMLLSIGACSDSGDLALSEPLPPPEEPGIFGSLAVGKMDFEVVDASRQDRWIYADVWYPVDAQDAVSEPLSLYPLLGALGINAQIAVDNLMVSSERKMPLLIFSHGFGGTNTQSTPLMETLASHGFVVVSPAHTGNTQDDRSDPNALENRVPDISFMIDTMLARNADPLDAFYDRIDPDSIGVLGHSVGGATSLGMALGMAGAPADFRVDAIAPISAAVAGNFVAEDFASIDVPMLLLGGTLDTSVPITLNDLVFANANLPGKIFNVGIEGATHTHFANICAIANFLLDLGLTVVQWPSVGAAALIEPYNITCSPEAFPIEEAVRLQNVYIVSFFKAFLLDDARYLEFLSEVYAATEPAILFEAK
ncbi:MAG: putative dienelactone hydrolase [Halieaceae bacterium]|jgi:predicted dienelactone hydrolase